MQPGYKYNLTDIAAAIGLQQLSRAEEMRKQREAIAEYFLSALADVDEIELPPHDEDRIHSWHLFPIRLNLKSLSIDRNEFIQELNQNNVGTSVHWRPLHMHPLYNERLGWNEHHLPAATKRWTEIISLPIFSAMTFEEMAHVADTVKALCSTYSVSRMAFAA